MATSSEKSVTPIVELGSGQSATPAGVERDRSTRLGLVLAGVVGLALLGLTFGLPGNLLEKLTLLNTGICPQRPGHSYFFEGQQMPLEARMVGIFAGYLITLIALWLVGRGRALQMPSRWLTVTLVGMIVVMAVDGLNSTAWDVGWPTFYEPQNWLRLLTGAVSGVGMAGLILPVFSLTIWRRGYLTPTFRRGREIGYVLIVAGLYVLGTLSGWGFLFWPLSLLAVGGVVVMLVMFNWIILAVMLRRENRVEGGLGLFAPATLVLLVSLGQMGLFALFRIAVAGVPGSL